MHHGDDDGAGRPCPECGLAGAVSGQLVCRGCYVPFALMAAPAPAAVPSAVTLTLPPQVPVPGITRRDAPGRVLRLVFPDGAAVIEPGGRIRLGRDPQQCPSVRFLVGRDNLSRLHASVGVDPDGSAWITDEGSTNGTFVRGTRITAGERVALRPGDALRLAADVTARVES
ncbi:FHA domain-containing protein [Streptomyces sp. H39-S7]|uniref:FHA domain-containing protein n=1 Tax=Streptomyces sp. H39-S7 TaxID=3004357 RepID=UPI0022B00049|nr:FHA domain-containing protein [Streptomyces sp. H39-S7]MCZ4119356.1 FHA domain-containing protein [Streptomyces sp. H39-S7]